jgi:hypothetical protein
MVLVTTEQEASITEAIIIGLDLAKRVFQAHETFLASLTRRRLQHDAFHSLVELQAAINRYLGEQNRKPKPFVWTADPDRIIEKVNRGYQATASNH